ncbi:hypothetical protein ACH0BF_16830 [Pseudobacillus sp. 179-B 2D1 NHS]|uniref:hypothetical protein n=1 Tax=Pseudobacillus sp. 179-B 2D1 NHS TaxID=3374292 RepID=UPI00387A51F5
MSETKKLREEWSVMAIGASLKEGTVFEFKKKSNPNVAVTIYRALTEEEAWKVLAETVKVTV